MKFLVGVLGVAMLVGCSTAVQPTPTPTRPPLSTSTPSTWPDWPVPNDKLTPGAVITCTLPRPQSDRNVPESEKLSIIAAYHYTGKRGIDSLEFDHRVPFALCGDNGPKNVWPEPYDGVKTSGFVHNYKDQLEDVIIRAVKSGKLTLAQGQDIFLGDWRQAWCVWIHSAGVPCA